MQVTFFTTKKNFIKLFEWMKANIEDVVFLDYHSKKEYLEDELYLGEVGFGKQIFISTKQLTSKFIDFSFKESHMYGIELSFCYSDESIYTSDYTMYNPYKEPDRKIYSSRIYRDGFYNDLEETKILKPIYTKIVNKIKSNSNYKNYGYIVGYFLYFKK